MIQLIVNDAKTTLSQPNIEADTSVVPDDVDFAEMITLLIEGEKPKPGDVMASTDQLSADPEPSAEVLVEDVALAADQDDWTDPAQLEFGSTEVKDVEKPNNTELPKAANVVEGQVTIEGRKTVPDAETDVTMADKTAHVVEQKTGTIPTAAQSVVEGQFPRDAQQNQPSNRSSKAAVPDAEAPPEPQKLSSAVPELIAKPGPAAKDLMGTASHTVPPTLIPDKRHLVSDHLDQKPHPVKADGSIGSTKQEPPVTAKSGAVAMAELPAALQFAQSKMIKGIAAAEASGELMGLSSAGERPVVNIQTLTVSPATAGPETARHVAGQLAAAITAQPGRTTEIALNPEELGKVRLSMNSVDTTIILSVIAERPETTDLLRRHIDMLAQEFKALGFENISFSFEEQSQAGADGGREDDTHKPAENDVVPADAHRQMRTNGQNSGLDLRL